MAFVSLSLLEWEIHHFCFLLLKLTVKRQNLNEPFHVFSFLKKKKKQQKKSCAAQKQNRSTFLIDFSLFFFVFLIRNFGRRFESIVREKDRKQIHNLIYIRAGLSLARLIRPMEFITILSNWISLIQMSFDLQIFIFC